MINNSVTDKINDKKYTIPIDKIGINKYTTN